MQIVSRVPVSVNDRFGLLFEDAKRRVIHTENATDSECTFSPNTKQTKDFPAINKTFQERNEQCLEHRKQRPKSVHNLSEIFTFSPVVGRGPKVERKDPSEAIEKYLHRKQNVKELLQSSKRSQSSGKIIKPDQNDSFTLSTSKIMVEKRLDSCIRGIFAVLDSDKDGKVSSNAINIKGMWSVVSDW